MSVDSRDARALHSMSDTYTSVPKRRFYVAAGVLMAVIVLVGFWPTYFGPLLSLSVERSAVIHFHAAVFVGWLALFVTQAALAATGHIRRHRQVGRFGIGYGVLVILVGVVTTLYQYAGEIRASGVEESLAYPIWPLVDMLMFAPVFGLSIAYRHKPEIHKRLMIVATTTLLIAAAGRMPLPTPLVRVVWLSPIILGMGYDFLKSRIVHPAYVIGVAVLFISGYRDGLMQTDVWPAFARWLGTLFT